MSNTCNAKLHYYRFNVSIPAERKQYDSMVDRIKQNQPGARGRFPRFC